MRPLAAVLLFLVFALLVPNKAVARPPERVSARMVQENVYFPTRVGAKWIYDVNGEEETEVVTAVKMQGRAIFVTVHQVIFLKESDIKMKLAEDGLYQLTGVAALPKSHKDVETPSLILRLPYKPGMKWRTFTAAWPFGESTFTAYGPERVEVPAGKYQAIRVETTDAAKTEPNTIQRTYWYAPGVGLVKFVFEHGKDKYVRTLKSFTPGKD